MRRALPILILALALLAAGCGGSDDTGGTTESTTGDGDRDGRAGRLQRRDGAGGS